MSYSENGNGTNFTMPVQPYGGNSAAAAFTSPTKGGTSQVLFNANATTPATPHTLQETAFYDQDTPENTPHCLHEAICTWLEETLDQELRRLAAEKK